MWKRCGHPWAFPGRTTPACWATCGRSRRIEMKVPINLASQPFRRDRAMIVASAAVGVMLVFSLGVLITLAISDRHQSADVRRDIARLNRLVRESTKAQAENDAVLHQPANAEVLERSV